MEEEWKIVERPGYFGTDRERIHERYNERFGEENWRISWEWNGEIIKPDEALLIYQRAYARYLENNPGVLEWLTLYEDIYDTSPSNVESGFDYSIQETPNNHIHDIATRRAVVLDLGRKFTKQRGLLHIRPGQEGDILGPHLIPFHLPHLIYPGPILYKGGKRDFDKKPPWWQTMGIPGSLEQFYQQGKVLEVRAKRKIEDHNYHNTFKPSMSC